MFSCEICETFKKTCFQEHLPTHASTNERQLETYALLDKKNESFFSKPIARATSGSQKLKLLEFESIT